MRNKDHYLTWAKRDEWSLDEAACLFHATSPSAKAIAKRKISETRDILSTWDLGERELRNNIKNNKWENTYHPYKFIEAALLKELSIPEALLQEINNRRKKEGKSEFEKHYTRAMPEKSDGSDTEVPQATRAKTNQQKLIVLFGYLLAVHLPRYQYNNSINCTKIRDDILEIAKAAKLNTDGLCSLDRLLGDGIKALASQDNLNLKSLLEHKEIKKLIKP